MGFDPNSIEADCTFPIDDKGKWDLYFSLLRTTISSLLKEYGNAETTLKAIPIVKTDSLVPSMQTFSVYILSHAKYTQGCGRFVTDALSTYLVPGKYTTIILSRSARFIFKEARAIPLFFTEYLIQSPNQADFEILKINLPKLLRNIRLSILSTHYARRFIQKRKMSTIEKELLIHENIQDLFERSNKKISSPFFAQIPKRFLEGLSEKEAGHLVMDMLADVQAPFKRSIFFEMHSLISLLPAPLQHEYPQRFIVRLLSFAYLFQKIVSFAEGKRAIPDAVFKVMPLREGGHSIHRCGLLMVLRVPKEKMQFDHQGIFRICQKLIPHLKKRPECFFTESRDGTHCKTIFIELIKEHHLPFTGHDISLLNNRLLFELKSYFNSMSEHAPSKKRLEKTVLVKELQSQIIEKGRYNDALLTDLINSFTTTVELNNEWLDSLSRCYYMFYALLDENGSHIPFHIAAQTVEDVFIVAISTKVRKIHEKVSSVLALKKNGDHSTLSFSFRFESEYLSALFFRYEKSADLKKFRSNLLFQLQKLQLEVEAMLESL